MFRQSLKAKFAVAALILIALQTVACAKMENATDQASYKKTTATVLPPDPVVVVPTPKPTVKTPSKTVLVDRFYIVNLFKDVFGPKALLAQSIRVDVRPQDLGSACSVYSYYFKINPVNGAPIENDPRERCSATSPDLTSPAVIPQATVTSQVLIAHACSDMVNNATTMNYALSRIQASGVPAATEANILKAYRLFYKVGAEPHKGLTDSLLVMLPQTGVTADHWRVVINTICSSGFWQAI